MEWNVCVECAKLKDHIYTTISATCWRCSGFLCNDCCSDVGWCMKCYEYQMLPIILKKCCVHCGSQFDMTHIKYEYGHCEECNDLICKNCHDKIAKFGGNALW